MNFFKRIFSGKKVKFGGVAILFSAVFIAAAVVLNIFAGVLTDKLGLRFDLSDERLFEISDETIKFLQNDLQEDIKIIVFSQESLYIDNNTYAPIREVLLRYVALSGGKISVEYIDPYSNHEITAHYSEGGTTITGNSIVVESARRYRVLNVADLYSISTDYETQEQYVAGLQAEQKLSSAVMYCIVDELPKALRIQGHGEEVLPSFNSLLISGNYTVDTINLLTTDIPEDCEMLIVAGPTRDFTPEEVEKLDAYFERNGNMIVFYKVSTPTLPVFERFMADWGIRYENTLVADSVQSYTHPANLAPSMTSHAMLESIVAGNSFVLAPGSRAISMLWSTSGWRTVSPILVSSSASYGKQLSAGGTISTYTKEDGDLSGPFAVAVLSEQNIVKNMEPNYSRILFCTLDMASNTSLGIDTFLNNRFFVQALNYMNESADSIIVETKYYTSSQLTITAAQGMSVFWVLVVAFPVIILGTGVVVWVRRRNA